MSEIEDRIEASSLGTPEAKAARASVSDETAARVVARSWQIEAEDLRAQIRDLLEEREELLTEIVRLRMGNHPAGRVGAVGVRSRGPCSHCPPGCGSCWPPDCECYDHQDWPDTRPDPVLAARLARCLDASGCDGHSHDITCNDAPYGAES